jgi:hypothetical protein
MLTTWLNPIISGAEYFCGTAFVVIALAVVYMQLDGLARQRTLNKTGLASNAPHTATIMTKIGNFTYQRLLLLHGLTCA